MSTKIYTAYRVTDPTQLWDLVEYIQRQGRANVRAKLRELHQVLADNLKTDTELFRRRQEQCGHEDLARLSLAAQALQRAYRRQVTCRKRNPFHFDVTVAVKELNGQFYLIPYADWTMEQVLDFLADDPRLEDFAYWNNTDRPEEIPEERWEERARIWNAIHDRGWSSRTLLLDVCSWGSYWEVCPEMEMIGELHRKHAASQEQL